MKEEKPIASLEIRAQCEDKKNRSCFDDMAKKGEHRILVGLVCSVCKNRNFITSRNKINTLEKLVLKKFCNHCRKVTEHKESEKLK